MIPIHLHYAILEMFDVFIHNLIVILDMEEHSEQAMKFLHRAYSEKYIGQI